MHFKSLIFFGLLLIAVLTVAACEEDADFSADANEVMPTCAACHDLPPATGRHGMHVNGEGVHCTRCHNESIAADGTEIPGGLHNDGNKDVDFRDGGSFNGNSCDPSCHGSESW